MQLHSARMYYKLNYNIYFFGTFLFYNICKKNNRVFLEVVPLKILVFQEAHISEKNDKIVRQTFTGL